MIILLRKCSHVIVIKILDLALFNSTLSITVLQSYYKNFNANIWCCLEVPLNFCC